MIRNKKIFFLILVLICLVLGTVIFLLTANHTTENKIQIKKEEAKNSPEIVSKTFDTKNNQQVDSALKTRELIVGKWARLPDQNQIVEKLSDGTAVVWLNGQETDRFQWEIVNSIKNPNIKYPVKPGDLFLREYTESGADRYYLIKTLDDKNLQIIYTYNGRTLSYTRVE